MLDQNTLDQAWNSTKATQAPKAAPKKKGPGGIAGFLVNSLPAIGGGLGAVAGIPGDLFSAGASSVAGGAAGAGLGESLKRKLLGQNQSLKETAIQAGEGGILSGVGGAVKGASSLAKPFVKGSAETVAKTAAPETEDLTGGFLKNLTKDTKTQAQQAQARTMGLSTGSKINGKELTPQDFEQMRGTLNKEGIRNSGNANNMVRDIVDKKNMYGKQIGDHFKTNNHPLTEDDTAQIAQNFMDKVGAKESDPRYLKEAQILADNLQKTTKDSKSLWEYRTSLDGKIPDTKQGATMAVTNRIAAIKDMRRYLADELGHVPGMQQYHELSEIKPFVSAEAKRLNNPSGGILGRLASSGPVQKLENIAGKGAESLAQKLDKGEPQLAERGVVDETKPQRIAAGATPPPTPPVVPATAGATGAIPEDVLQAASEATKTLPEATPVGKSFLDKILQTSKQTATLPARIAAAPLAYPGQSAGQVLKQEAGRGFGVPASISEAQKSAGTDDSAVNPSDLSNSLLSNSADSDTSSSDPFDTSNVQSNVQSILAQGGTMKDVSDYLSNVKAYQALTSSTSKPLNSTQQQQANNANSGLSDIQNLADMLGKDPSLLIKDALPGGSVTQRIAGTTDYNAAKTNIVDVISRLRSGAAINAQEEKTYKSLLPSAGDTQESATAKLTRLASLLQSFSTPANAGGSDASDALSSLGL